MAVKLLRKTGTLALRNGVLRLAVVADTHSAPHPKASERLRALEAHHILHAGDIGTLTVIDELAKIAPTSAVRGNIDVHAAEVPDILTLDVVDGVDGVDGVESLFKILLLHIAVNGPRLRADAVRLAKSEGAQLVICGHSHVPFIGRDRDLSIFNPGSIGPRRYPLPIVFGVIDVTRARVDMKHVDCESGARWMP